MFFKDAHLRRLTSYDILSLPNSTLKPTKVPEYSSACPVCGGHDRFIYWSESGGYWCRQCGLSGIVLDATPPENKKKKPSPITYGHEEVATWEEYHQALLKNKFALRYWETALGPQYMDAVEYYGLGFCQSLWKFGATMTIPVSYVGKKFLVKHRRLLQESPKYLTEPRHVGAMFFNVDQILDKDRVVLVEGEKKAIRLSLAGYPSVSSTAGALGFEPAWKVFLLGKEVTIICDPDPAGEKAAKRMQELVGGKILSLPDKVDDWINQGGSIKEYLGEPWYSFTT